MRIKPVTYLLILLFSCLVLQGFPTGKYKIGFSQCTTSDHWRQTQLRLMEMELSFYPDMELQVKDAGDNNELQIRQINEFLAEGIDLLIVSPNESEPVTPVVEKVFNQGIPVIVIDRTINTDRYTAYIGGNNYEIGLEAGRYAAALLKGKGDILEIKGLSGSSPAIARHAGFLKSLESYPNIRIVKSADGEWNWNIARQVMTNLVNSRLNYDLIFAHNDVMALEAYKVLRESASPLHPYILGIDGLPGDNGGIQYVLDGRLDATFLYPTGGEKAIQTAHQILTGLPYKKQNIMSTMVIDSTNARILKMQTDETELLQQKIEKQRSILATQLLKNKTQRSALISLIALLAVTAAFIVVIFQALRTRKRANRALEQKNQEIEKQKEAIITQRDQLVEVSRQLEEATQAKLRFYTNISHEFRTPLTLIKGPLENLMESEEFSPAHRYQFNLMHRNTVRLLRLVNQLMDFRKLENQKMELAASENDLLAFLGDIRESFSSLAGKRNIDLQVIS
ncbi:MAG TPA: substrate-binding domain-containing protein, partial [Prolixibacteraceae bacterium]|nr:substrate-binding domain-containing protein [Prolixibacteraceae bacterium]